jgi:hypothetical protein
MTTPSTPRKAGPLLGTGAQTSWPFTFKVFAASDIAVTIANNLGVETALVLNADYSVTVNANQDTSPGGTVTYPISGSALPTGSKLTIFGNLPYDQPLDLPSGGNFSPLALENQLDRLTMQIQQLREQVGRSLTVPVTSGVSPSLPSPTASNIIGWNASGDNLENYPLSELATSLAFATYRYDTFTGNGSTTQFTLSADPVTLGNLDVAVGGVTQIPGADYLLVDGVLAFTSAPPLGATILARFGEGIASGPSMDSYDVRFRQAGTGAVDRTAEAKMREWVSVKDFGAVGDGVADDTAAIQAALDAIGATGGGTVVLPAGSYKVSALILKHNNIRLLGAGSGSRLLCSSDPTTLHNPTVWIARNDCAVEEVYFSYTTWNDGNYASFAGTRPDGNSYYGCHVAVNYTELYTSANSGIYNTFRGVALQVVYNPIIRSCTFHGTALHAVAMFSCFGAVVESNLFEQFKGTGVLGFITPNTLVQGNRFVSSGDDATFFGNLSSHIDGVWTPITAAQCRDIRIIGNNAEKIGAKLWCACGYNYVVIANNTSNYQRSDGIYVRSENSVPAGYSLNVIISGNVLQNCGGGFGLLSDGFAYSTEISSVVGGEYYAINGADCFSVNVTGNTVYWDTRLPGAHRPFHFLSADNVSITGNNFMAMRLGPADVGSVSSGNVAANYVITNNQFIKASGIGGRCLNLMRGLSSAIVSGNIFYCDQAYDVSAGQELINTWEASKVILVGNIFNNPNSFKTVRTADGITNSYLKENISTGYFGDRPTTNAPEKMIGYGTAAPSTGNYAAGDVVFNTSASAGGYVGWVCVVGGTPGTWKTFGAISA